MRTGSATKTHAHNKNCNRRETGEKNIHNTVRTHTYTFMFKETTHTLIHKHRKNTWRGKHVHTTHTHTQKVHYNEPVDGRPLCRDPDSCSALGADHEQRQGETGSKQSQSMKTHTHTSTHTDTMTHITHTFSQIFMHHTMQMQDTHVGHNVANQ